MIRHARHRFFLGIIGALSLTFLPGVVRAQVLAIPTITLLNGGVYHYDYAITNNTPDDLFDVSIHVLPGPAKVFNVNAPTGFVFAYDSGLGLVDYLENTDFFTAMPLSGFTYDSFLAPNPSVFDANRVDLATGDIITTTNTTLAAVPEPGSLGLLLSLSATAGLAWRKRRHASK